MLIPLSSTRFVWLSFSVPHNLPFYSSNGSWNTRESGYISLRSFRLPFLWALTIHAVPSERRLEQLGLPLP